MGYIFTPKMSNTEKQYLQYIEHSRWGVLASSPPFKRGEEGIICTGPSELYKKHFNMLACDYSPWTTLNLQMNRTNLQLGLAPKNLTKACVALQVIQQSTPNDCEDKIEWYLPEHVQKIVMSSAPQLNALPQPQCPGENKGRFVPLAIQAQMEQNLAPRTLGAWTDHQTCAIGGEQSELAQWE